jgi:hypothetical protein
MSPLNDDREVCIVIDSLAITQKKMVQTYLCISTEDHTYVYC